MNYLPDVVSFVVATCLGCVALLPSPKKSHWLRVSTIIILVVLAVGACGVSIKAKHETEVQADLDRRQAAAREEALQRKVDEANSKLDDDLRTKEAHPIELAAYGATVYPKRGSPSGFG